MLFPSLAVAALPVASVKHREPVDYPSEIAPMLKSSCTACHNKTTSKGGLNMETPDLMMKGGDSGTALVPGKARESLIFLSATHDESVDSEMPPKGNKVNAPNLKPEQLALLMQWINEGAKAGQKKPDEIVWQSMPGGLNPVYAVAMSGGGELVACGRGGRVYVYDVTAKREVAQFDAHRDMIMALAFSPDGRLLVSGSFGEVKLWQADAVVSQPSEKALIERKLGLASLDTVFYSAQVAAAEKDVATVKTQHKNAVDAAANAKKALAAVKSDPKVPDAKKNADAAVLNTATEASRVGKLLDESHAKLAKLQSDLATAKASEETLKKAVAAAKPSDTAHKLPTKWTRIAVLGTGDVGSPISDRVNALAFSPDGRTLAVGAGEPSRGGDITLWDVAAHSLKATWADRHTDTVLALDWSHDGKLLASGGADKQLRITEVATGKLVRTFEGHTHHVMGVSWRADGRIIATAGADNVVKVWDWVAGARLKNLDGWDKEVTAVRYLGTSRRLATTSGDSKVRVIGEDASAPALLTSSNTFLHTAAVSGDGAWLAAGGEDGTVRVWKTAAPSPAAEFALTVK